MSGFATVTLENSNGVGQRKDRMLILGGKKSRITALLAIQAILVYLDFLSGPWIPFGVFYLLTLFIAVKYFGVRVAYVMAFIIVCGKTYVKATHVSLDILWWQLLWQFISSFSIYTLFSYLINSQLTARRCAEKEVILASNRAGAAEKRLLDISEETQQRIGRELHDDLGQHITGIAFMAQVLSRKLKDSGREERADAERITLMLNQAILKTRNIAHGLYPAEIEELGLQRMLEKFVEHVEVTYNISCSFSFQNSCDIEDHEVAIHLFRIAQETVSNAVKHGHANRITLRLSRLLDSQILEISDNGCGLDTKMLTFSEGLGIRSMRYRAELIGASLDISSRIDGGTRVIIDMPINPQTLEEKDAV